MRYFVIMQDGVIKPATGVSKQESSGRVYFDVDGKMYRHLTPTCDCEHYMLKRIKLPIYSFQQFIHDDWFNTDQIKYLIYFNEEEDSDLNYFQSTDFNAGVIYAQIERAMGKLLGSSLRGLEKEIKLPKIQVVPKCAGLIKETEVLDATMTAVLKHFATVYGERFDIVINHYNDLFQKQYIVFKITVRRKEEYKEMTIADIEEALGYKIKVVGDK